MGVGLLRRSTPVPTRIRLDARSHHRATVWTALLIGVVVVSAVLCLGIGPSGVSPLTAFSVVGHHLGLPITPDWSPADEAIVWNLRTPRVLLAAAVGAALAISGAVLQAMVRNVLAEPYVLGISSGASTGAAGSILFGFATGIGQYALPVSAFVGALAASLIVFALARSNGQVTSVRLLLSGIAVGYALSAATSFLVFASDNPEGSRSVMFWMLGSLALASWGPLLMLVLVVTLAAFGFFLLWSSRLDVLAVGDQTALALGVRPDRARIQLLVAVSLCIGVSVAAAGAIGFVGLVIPHLARRLVGATHARLLPVTALLGSALLIWADAVGRVLMQPRELPIGILTALVGAPFLVVLVRRVTVRHP